MRRISDSPRRIVLFPYGPAQTAEAQTELIGHLIACGGDHSRVIDIRFADTRQQTGLDRFITHLKRARIKDVELSQAIVVLTKTSPPLMTAVKARKDMIRTLNSLQSAVWIIFADPGENPFLITNLGNGQTGALDDAQSPTPVWRDLYDLEYLVIRKGSKNVEFLTNRFEDVASRIKNGFATLEPDSSRYATTYSFGSR